MNRQSRTTDPNTERKFTDEEIDDLAQQLNGTCQTVNEALRYDDRNRSEDDMTRADHQALDGEIACCETCSWWCEPAELDEDGNCDDCRD